MAVMADNQCVLFPDHTTVNYLMHNGVLLQGRPTWGAWAIYTLRSANVGLLGYIVLNGGQILSRGLNNFTL